MEKLDGSKLMSELKHTVVTFFTKMPVKEVTIAILFMLLYRMPEGLLAKEIHRVFSYFHICGHTVIGFLR